MSKTAIMIPARYGSTRFPGKPLADLAGKTMIERVYETCLESGLDTYVLTDDERVAEKIGAGCIVDKADYANGTERCAGGTKYLPEYYDRIINVQGDMPDITVDIISQVCDAMNYHSLVTAYTIMDPALRADPNTVKIVVGNQMSCWFGRGFTYGEHHLGIYGYRRFYLEQYLTWPPSAEEEIEKLEQLRWLANDMQFGSLQVEFSGVEINTPKDQEKWNESR